MSRPAARLSAVLFLLCPLAPFAFVGCSGPEDGVVPHDESTELSPEEQEAFDEKYLRENAPIDD